MPNITTSSIHRSNRGLIVAASILHDIGKLRELEYHPVEAKYTIEGCLIGHVLMGRDMVREAAQRYRGVFRRAALEPRTCDLRASWQT